MANYFPTKVRGAAVAWCAGFGRLGGVGGPLLGGFLIAAGLALNSIFYVLAAVAVLGVILTLLVPTRRTQEVQSTPVEPSVSRERASHRSGAPTRPRDAAVDDLRGSRTVVYERILVAIEGDAREARRDP